ncbi:MAG: hypothetical protein IKA47_12445 [Oscillospiraceae bacterium]|nr:hypothetical protein [Oscillospiraceae bacterium]
MEKITIAEVEKLAKEHGVEIDYLDALNTAIAKKHEMQQPMNYETVFRLGREDYPELKRATIVITDMGNCVTVGVKAIGRVFEAGGLNVREELFGDYCELGKDVPLDRLFGSLKELFVKVSNSIDECNKDVEA